MKSIKLLSVALILTICTSSVFARVGKKYRYVTGIADYRVEYLIAQTDSSGNPEMVTFFVKRLLPNGKISKKRGYNFVAWKGVTMSQDDFDILTNSLQGGTSVQPFLVYGERLNQFFKEQLLADYATKDIRLIKLLKRKHFQVLVGTSKDFKRKR